uniref:NADH-ubiquinone oxidoreductase chain 3 n=2 Tax=Parasagitta elegans TaxID=1562708 RepID=A0A141CLI8_9BILA|nr:NADH dehydrogenase subunit 3 [Parasagitta elegans]AKS04384.1 NADH dehydrogenase subunit 3 [Parasagitta elegans]
MISLLVYGVVTTMVAIVLMSGILLSYKLKRSHEKGSPFECGFDASGVCRVPFCMKFFLVCIIFLVFDVEVSLVFPMIYSMYQVLSFLMILLGGLVFEWAYGGLNWMV